VIEHGPQMRVTDLPEQYGEIAEARTSGSTGVPLRVATNGQVFFAGNALLTRMARWFGLDTARGVASIRRFIDEAAPQYPDGRVGKGWSYAHADAPIHELDMTTPVHQQLEWLGRVKAPYLFTQPSLALAIAHAATPAKGRDLGIEAVLLFGETVPDGTYELIAERLGARTASVYSCREVGVVACECASAPHYHVAA
jgi:phenylacetate-CoA ligase